MEKIYVQAVANTGNEINEIINMMRYAPGIKDVYKNKEDRIEDSLFSILIKNEADKTIGFLNLVDEKESEFLFVDMAIKERYRGNGYAPYVLKEIINDLKLIEFLIVIVEKENKNANKSAKKIGRLVFQNNEKNFYLLNNFDKFDNKDLTLLANHTNYQKTKVLKRF